MSAMCQILERTCFKSMFGSYDSFMFAHAGAPPFTVLPRAFTGFSFRPHLTFLFPVGVILRHHSRADEDRDWIADAVQTEGGPGPHQSRWPPQASDLLVHRRDCPLVCHRCWTGHDAQELLHGEERFCCSHYLELRDTMLLQKDENLSEKCYFPLLHVNTGVFFMSDPEMSQNWEWCLWTLKKCIIYYRCLRCKRWNMLISLSTITETVAALRLLLLKFLWINVQKL